MLFPLDQIRTEKGGDSLSEKISTRKLNREIARRKIKYKIKVCLLAQYTPENVFNFSISDSPSSERADSAHEGT